MALKLGLPEFSLFLMKSEVQYCWLEMEGLILMNLNYVSYFVEVAECKSISKAAEKLFLTPSALTISMKALEDEVGAKLLNRTHKGVTLTKHGEILYQDAKGLKEMALKWKNISLNKEARMEKIYLTTVPSISLSLLPKIVCDVTNRMPEIELHCKEAILTDINDLLFEKEIHYAICSYDCINRKQLEILAKNSGYCFEPIYDDHYKVFFRNTHPFSKLDFVSRENLNNYIGVTSSTKALYFSEVKQYYSSSSIYMENVMHHLYDIMHNDRYTVLPSIIEHSICMHDSIVAKPLKEPLNISFALLHPITEELSDAEKRFIKIVYESFDI